MSLSSNNMSANITNKTSIKLASKQNLMDGLTWRPDQKPGSSQVNAGETSKSTFYTNDVGFEDDFVPRMQGPDLSTLSEDSKDLGRRDSKPKGSGKAMAGKAYSGLENAIASDLQCYVVRLQKGQELRRALLKFVETHGLKGAFILSCIGSATSAKLRMAIFNSSQQEPNYMLDVVTPCEIVSVTGTLSGGGHLHASLSDHTGKVLGGHLLELIVGTTAEVVVGDCSGLSFKREYDASTGFNELFVEGKN